MSKTLSQVLSIAAKKSLMEARRQSTEVIRSCRAKTPIHKASMNPEADEILAGNGIRTTGLDGYRSKYLHGQRSNRNRRRKSGATG